MLTISELVEEFGFKVIAGQAGLDREITDFSLKRPSAELVGYLTYLTPQRIQIYGRTELGLLQQLADEIRYDNLSRVMLSEVPCIVVTRGLSIPSEFIQLAEERSIPLLTTQRSTTQLYYLLIRYLANRLAPTTLVHGVLVDVYGVGVLITGESGIGKSETALELIRGGHLLVADDAVEVQRVDEENLRGRAPQTIRHLLEVRGLGIMDVTQLFGAGAVREEKELHLLIKLEEWEEGKYYDRLGLDPPETFVILGIPVPMVTIPVRPGRQLASIIEVAVMQNRLRSRRG
ncbi:HPr(Ser) kinase/phosphatase [Desulfosporosinus fructosivorans]|uniref:HPr kinase/phosphorylase n=1 Tax=Desulfosporosinus fructosivorans TaxID=2018669 RepID=A0A4Z0R9M6_9FIRM|nr:HPr(Ser) kinase/phosphatase [Desulfosporosinus fructosivorans]TGE39852.1 HPr(Ser) kinase/phosphatase [Desulfosporosinus fructosivorans]